MPLVVAGAFLKTIGIVLVILILAVIGLLSLFRTRR